eukprot:818881_1
MGGNRTIGLVPRYTKKCTLFFDIDEFEEDKEVEDLVQMCKEALQVIFVWDPTNTIHVEENESIRGKYHFRIPSITVTKAVLKAVRGRFNQYFGAKVFDESASSLRYPGCNKFDNKRTFRWLDNTAYRRSDGSVIDEAYIAICDLNADHSNPTALNTNIANWVRVSEEKGNESNDIDSDRDHSAESEHDNNEDDSPVDTHTNIAQSIDRKYDFLKDHLPDASLITKISEKQQSKTTLFKTSIKQCEFKGSPHTSNTLYYVYYWKSGRLMLKCHSARCQNKARVIHTVYEDVDRALPTMDHDLAQLFATYYPQFVWNEPVDEKGSWYIRTSKWFSKQDDDDAVLLMISNDFFDELSRVGSQLVNATDDISMTQAASTVSHIHFQFSFPVSFPLHLQSISS